MHNYLKNTIIILLISCISTSYSYSQLNKNLPNVATLYNPALTTLHPDFTIFHKNDSISTVFAYINLNELNFIKLADRSYEAKIKLKFIFYESLEGVEIIDSLSEIFKLSYKDFNKSIILNVDFKMPDQKSQLVIISTDMYQYKSNIEFISVDKSNLSKQNLILIDSAYNVPVFGKYVKPYKKYFLKSKSLTDSFIVHEYTVNQQVATPPYSNKYNDNNLSLIRKFKVSSNHVFNFSKNHTYKICSLNDSSYLYFSCFDEYFPSILFAHQMIFPLKYITETTEYNNLTAQTNQKIAVDDFWLSKNQDKNYARKLIKIFYNRVIYTNKKFTTTKQGWMTDRGMIYIIFGPPNMLYVGDKFQEWVYYDKSSGEKISFVFELKATSKFSSDYILKRKQSYISTWQSALETWNSGKLYIF